jgi:hypothetical protein
MLVLMLFMLALSEEVQAPVESNLMLIKLVFAASPLST